MSPGFTLKQTNAYFLTRLKVVRQKRYYLTLHIEGDEVLHKLRFPTVLIAAVCASNHSVQSKTTEIQFT